MADGDNRIWTETLESLLNYHITWHKTAQGKDQNPPSNSRITNKDEGFWINPGHHQNRPINFNSFLPAQSILYD